MKPRCRSDTSRSAALLAISTTDSKRLGGVRRRRGSPSGSTKPAAAPPSKTRSPSMADTPHSFPHALSTEKAVVVIGAGTMGSGIAEVAASAGHRVYLRDTNQDALERGIDQIRRSLEKRLQRGRLDASARDAILGRLEPVGAESKLSDVGLVIEVIVERLDIKIAVLRQIEAEVGADAIIATNTSSLSVTAIAGGLSRPERVVGMHF